MHDSIATGLRSLGLEGGSKIHKWFRLLFALADMRIQSCDNLLYRLMWFEVLLHFQTT